MLIETIFIVLIILIISAIPLNIAVKLLGGDSSILKVIVVNLAVGFAALLLNSFFGVLGGLISFIAMLFIYKVAFDLGLIRAFLAWILQAIVVVVLGFIAIILFGAAIFATLI